MMHIVQASLMITVIYNGFVLIVQAMEPSVTKKKLFMRFSPNGGVPSSLSSRFPSLPVVLHKSGERTTGGCPSPSRARRASVTPRRSRDASCDARATNRSSVTLK